MFESLRLDDLQADMGWLEEPELEDAEAKVDRAEELREKWETEEGQLWLIEGKRTHRLLCGDATNRSMLRGFWTARYRS